ncbi:MAG: 1-(5-phosphoribosyl)-5-[(5-phosphoribosylamino)methylideneamino]imidazole-4-carboxamide isomerase [Anaerolineales bacterium]|nr:1-(5-phosphoribosyl)-5-[(5-phosphoribosylamino)methylideneamino]imidazole-4-carboxamide isomerase [Anaerolineales bacterium]MCS7248480.1 1-(5-phosphoribosyl)-5-[(5-phosphoribosylamino)methylideneamino]imidazole-4-carboxamide isomerase [Anaerolineales bacterium]MDW8162293.1 1-(5-phosphoribosyl)-5-[(5-phosphoribosylamino)methylideneamino]imidazole-4-carboxamide isomerase [Anaerolineales bacterium]MDW8446560.1 1-(5-phosphoribosyl)-5-[(5-phosphoribosylamino)methylideneamino]imidazole-4-carboxamid
MRKFTIYPAIDLHNGRVVRLQQGDPRRMTVYHDDPIATAERWVAAGARWLHIVNLDGAFGEEGRGNQLILEAICHALEGTGAQIQLGGGLRSLIDIERAFERGVSRVVLGTLALEEPAKLQEAVRRFGGHRIAVALDVKGREVAIRGWQESSRIDAWLAIRQMIKSGVRILVYTDISRDGMGSGLNLELARQILDNPGIELILSGGVNSLDDLCAAKRIGAAGAIIGKALYDGRIDLEAALHILEETC